MSDSPSFLVSPGALAHKARFPAHGARALRAEIEATKDTTLLSFLHHELGRICLVAGDLSAAARSALEAHELRPDLVEPLESLITIAHLKGSSSLLPKLLGELARSPNDPELSLRATFEFLAALLVRTEAPRTEADQIRSILEPMLESGPESAAAWLLAEITAALALSGEAWARAILGRVGATHSPELRGALLERAATIHQKLGDVEAARAALLQARDEFPHRGLFRRIEELAGSEGDFSTAAWAALEESALCEGHEATVPLLRRAFWLEKDGALDEARTVLGQLEELLPEDRAVRLLRASLEKRAQDRERFFLALEQAAAHAPEHDRDVYKLALLQTASADSRASFFDALESRLGASQIALGLRLWFELSKGEQAQGNFAAILSALRATEPLTPALEQTIQFLEALEKRTRGETGLGPRLEAGQVEEALERDSFSGLLFRAYFRDGQGLGLAESKTLDFLASELRAVVALARQDQLLSNPETRDEALLELRSRFTHDPSDLVSAIALARGLEEKPADVAFILLRAAEGSTDPDLRAALYLWAGLELSGAKNDRAARLFLLAEEALPGALGDAAPYFGITEQEHSQGSYAVLRAHKEAQSWLKGDRLDSAASGDSEESRALEVLRQLARGEIEVDGEAIGLSGEDRAIVIWGNAFDGSLSENPLTHGFVEPTPGPLTAILEAVWDIRKGREKPERTREALRELIGESPADFWFSAESALAQGDIPGGLSILDQALAPSASSGDDRVGEEPNQERLTLDLLRAHESIAEAALRSDKGLAEEALAILLSIQEDLGQDETFLLALLAAAELLEKKDIELAALEKLAVLRDDTVEAAELWERVGLLRLSLELKDLGTEQAFERALELDPDRDMSFRHALLLARARQGVEAELRALELRSRGSLSPERRARLLWERARVARRAGRAALELETLDALKSESAYRLPVLGRLAQIHLKDGRRREAAECLTNLVTDPFLPSHAVETLLGECLALWEELGEPGRALTLLESVRVELRPAWYKEELARKGALAGRHELAFAAFSELNDECDDIPRRLHYARLMLTIARDHLKDPRREMEATRRVLRDSPVDRDAVDSVRRLSFSIDEKRALLAPSLEKTKRELMERPLGGELASRYVELAEAGGEPGELPRARGIGRLLGRDDSAPPASTARPVGAFAPDDLERLYGSEVSEDEIRFLSLVGKSIAPLTQPDLASLDLSYLLAASSEQESHVFEEIRPFARAFGLSELRVIVGGRDPSAWFLIQMDPPVFVVGSAIPWPLSERRVARLAAELASASGHTLSLLSLPDRDAEAWLSAAIAPSDDRDRSERRALLRERTNGAEWTQIELLGETLSTQGITPFSLLKKAKARAIRASIVAVGHAGALAHVQHLLPESEPERQELLASGVRFALGADLEILRRRAGWS